MSHTIYPEIWRAQETPGIFQRMRVAAEQWEFVYLAVIWGRAEHEAWWYIIPCWCWVPPAPACSPPRAARSYSTAGSLLLRPYHENCIWMTCNSQLKGYVLPHPRLWDMWKCLNKADFKGQSNFWSWSFWPQCNSRELSSHKAQVVWCTLYILSSFTT